MRIRALKTFMSKHGLVRTGIVTTVDDRYAQALIRGRLAVEAKFEENLPEANAALPHAPHTKVVVGNVEGEAGNQDEHLPQDEPDQEDGMDASADSESDGMENESSSRRRAPRSRKKTSTRSRGARG